jgi:hypothetical protein
LDVVELGLSAQACELCQNTFESGSKEDAEALERCGMSCQRYAIPSEWARFALEVSGSAFLVTYTRTLGGSAFLVTYIRTLGGSVFLVTFFVCSVPGAFLVPVAKTGACC